MSWQDRLRSLAEDRLGVNVLPAAEVEQLRESQVSLARFMEEANELAYTALNYWGGKPQELRPERRARLAQRSRIALMEDPQAGAEANLLANFAFGRGVGMPQAANDRVQQIIEEAWNDPVNQMKLTSFEAQRHRSNELLTQANLFPTAYVRNGRVRLGFLDADLVEYVVTDPDDEELPLYYVTRERRVEWDFEADRIKTTDEMLEGGRPKLRYFKHWRNVDDLARDAERNGEQPPPGPAAEKLADGLVEHIRINRIGRTQFGTPPWARTLRFYSALNQLTTAHVQMAQAASSIVAKQTITGSKNELARQASNLLSQTGELAAARFGQGPPPPDIQARIPPPAASFMMENQGTRLEPVALQSGSGQMVASMQIVRAPIAAASGFGQHYLGDASSANLSTATSLELPTLMTVQAWQETHEQMVRWFVNLVIQEAVKAGRLGGRTAFALSEEEGGTGRPLEELCYETDQAEMERLTGLDLGYTLEMPYPGRRNLPDVVNLVTAVAAGYDPYGQNVPLRRSLLNFLATHGMQLADPQGWVDEVLPEDSAVPPLPQPAGPNDGSQQGGGTGAGGSGGSPKPGSPEKKQDPSKGDRPKNAQTGAMNEADRLLLAELDRLGEETAGIFRDEVLEPLLTGS